MSTSGDDDVELGARPKRRPVGPRKSISWSEHEDEESPIRRYKNNDTIEELSDEDEEGEDDDDLGSPVSQSEIRKYSTTARRDSTPRRPSLSRQDSKYSKRLKEEDESANANFEHYLAKKKSVRIEDKSRPSAAEAYDFFTKVWVNNSPSSLESATNRPQQLSRQSSIRSANEDDEDEESEAAQQQEAGNKVKKVYTHDIIGELDFWNQTEFRGVDFVDTRIKIENEKRNFFVPSNEKIDVEKKLSEDERPRFYEEEGIFVGERPKVNPKNRNKLENRLLNESKESWFGRDGRLVALPDPIQRKSTRPIVYDSPATDTVFCPPNLPGPDGAPAGTEQPGLVNTIISNNAQNFTHCQLEVDLNSIVFDHHHLFSLEHFLSVELTEAFVEYQGIVGRQKSLALERRLKVLYEAVDHLKEKLEICVQKAERDFQTRRLEAYRKETKMVREQRDNESLNERNAIKKMLSLWKSLKDCRKKTGFHNTGVKLVIHREQVNLEEDAKLFYGELQRELEDKKEEYEINFEAMRANYEEDLNAWKEVHNRRKEARRRQKQRDKNSEQGIGSVDVKEMALDEEILAQPEEEKPEPPGPFDEVAVMTEIEDVAKKCRRPPGETKITLELQMNVTSSGDNEQLVDSKEAKRRNALKKTKIFAKIFFNGKEVCLSAAKEMNDDFSVNFGQIFPLQIVQWPESLKVHIYEGSSIKSTQLTVVSVPLCDTSTTLDSVRMEKYPFESGLRVKHDHSGLGSGVEFGANIDGSKVQSRSIRGKLLTRIGWGKSTDGVIMAPMHWSPPVDKTPHDLDLNDLLNADGQVDPVRLEEWMTKNMIDPNDPANVDLMERVTEASKKTAEQTSGSPLRALGQVEVPGGGYFRLDSHHDQLVFCTQEEIDNDIRFKLLQLRNNKVAEFRNFKMIPSTSKGIPRGIVERKVSTVDAVKASIGGGDPLRSRHRIFLEHLRTQVSHHFSIARHRKRHSDVVREEPIPTLDAIGTMLEEMGPAPRPLKPVRVERKKVAPKDGQDIRILLSVVRAYDVPVRSEQDPMNPTGSSSNLQPQQSSSSTDLKPKEANVHSYVEARFQGQSARTSTAPGPNPGWNQELSLKFKTTNNDFSPDTLNRVRDNLHIHLFDEVCLDLMADEDESERAAQIHKRLERKWLGSFSIPFTSLYANTRVEGTVRLHSPPVLLGYDRTGQYTVAAGLWSDMTNPAQEAAAKDATYLNIYLTIEPPLSIPEPVKEKLDCEESENVIRHCEKWRKDLEGRNPERKMNPLVANVNGCSILVTRFFKPLKPPKELFEANIEEKEKAEKIAWFVANIPYIPKNAIFPGLQDIWPNSGEFLSMLCGSEVEHALLLTNFFNSMGKRSYMLIGQAVPEGETAYVLTVEETGEYLLWNAVTAEYFSTSANFCPLQSVTAVLDDANVWGNIQSASAPGRIKWDFNNSSDWMPLFGKSVSNPNLPSVQPTQLTYSSPDPRAARQLKDRLERILREALMQMRPKQGTVLNFPGNAVLRKLLPGLEASHGGLSEVRSGNIASDHLKELSRICTSHKVCGFPLHFAFSDKDNLIEALRATGVHLNHEPKVEFALAVHVEPYPNSVMSVWVYVASLIRRR